MTVPTLHNGHSGKLYNMIILSLLLHLAAISIILVSVPSSPRRLTFGPVYSVRLVGSEFHLPNQQSTLLREIEKSSELISPKIHKSQPSIVSPTPTKIEETSKLNVEKAVSALKQKQINEPPAVTNVRQDPAGSSAARAASTSFSSWEKEYSAQTKIRIKKNFNIPQALIPKENIETVIAVKILRDGTLDYAHFEKQSGNRHFDDAALKAIKKSVPFAPFPENIKEKSIDIGIIFRPSQLY